MSQPKNRKGSGEGGVRDAEFLRVDEAGVSDQGKENSKGGETDLSLKAELHFCTQRTTCSFPIEHVLNHNVNNSLRPRARRDRAVTSGS